MASQERGVHPGCGPGRRSDQRLGRGAARMASRRPEESRSAFLPRRALAGGTSSYSICTILAHALCILGAAALALSVAPVWADGPLGRAEVGVPADGSDWLDLHYDQRAFRERAGRLSPAQAADLRLLERRQELDRLELKQRRRWDRQHEARGARRDQASSLGLRQREGRAIGRQRLDARAERERFGVTGEHGAR